MFDRVFFALEKIHIDWKRNGNISLFRSAHSSPSLSLSLASSVCVTFPCASFSCQQTASAAAAAAGRWYILLRETFEILIFRGGGTPRGFYRTNIFLHLHFTVSERANSSGARCARGEDEEINNNKIFIIVYEHFGNRISGARQSSGGNHRRCSAVVVVFVPDDDIAAPLPFRTAWPSLRSNIMHAYINYTHTHANVYVYLTRS